MPGSVRVVLLHAPTLEEALVLAVNLAGEADTIAGGAAEAYWGKGAIPERWLDAMYEREMGGERW